MSRTDVRVHERRVVTGHPAAWWLSVAGVATVLTVTLGALVLVRAGNPSAGSVRALVGTRWQLIAVRSANTSLPVADYVAGWEFGRNRRLTGVDGINGLAGTYRVVGDMGDLARHGGRHSRRHRHHPGTGGDGQHLLAAIGSRWRGDIDLHKNGESSDDAQRSVDAGLPRPRTVRDVNVPSYAARRGDGNRQGPDSGRRWPGARR